MTDVAKWRLTGDWFDVCKCTGPTTLPGRRVQTHNPPGAEVGPGQVATWRRATTDRAEGFGFKWEWDGRSSKHFPFDWEGP
jgi:hypothetical protein